MNAEAQFRVDLVRTVSVRLVMAIVLLSVMFFLPAGTLAYWEAWVYLGVLFVPMSLVVGYLWRNDPELLRRRMSTREQETEQKRIIGASSVFFLLIYLLPGFDRRFGWSNVPTGVVLLADVVVLLGYGVFFLVLRENSYASRTVQVEETQRVISSGPYAVVRHPMYVAVLLMCIFTPLALGSYWAMLAALATIPVIVLRIRNEEEVLRRDLEGYKEYTRRVQYRLLPGIW